MMWKVYNICMYDDHFTFNCYCHHTQLIMQELDGTDDIIII